jgi:hypothetical protein
MNDPHSLVLYLRAVRANGLNAGENSSSTMQLFRHGCIPVRSNPTSPYSPKLVEGVFSELHLEGVLRRWDEMADPADTQYSAGLQMFDGLSSFGAGEEDRVGDRAAV